MKWKSAITGFLCILAGVCIVPFATLNQPSNETAPEPQEIVEVVAPTNSVPSTNAIDRATSPSNLDWFKNNSNYIWDDWKIK